MKFFTCDTMRGLCAIYLIDDLYNEHFAGTCNMPTSYFIPKVGVGKRGAY